jgi:hypothetical protein
MRGDDPFAAVRYDVDARTASALAAHGPEAPQRILWRSVQSEVRSYARDHLTDDPGYFVLSGLEHLSESAARCFALTTSRMLGTVITQGFTGELLREVRDRGVRLGETVTARYSDTREGGSLHTDGMHRPGPVPDVVTLFCVRPARRGGALVLVPIGDLLEHLHREHDVLLATLRLPFHFDTRSDGSPGVPRTVSRPVLDDTDQVERVHYLREYIESGHRYAGIAPLSSEQVRALDVFDGLLARRDLQTHGRLRAGEMVFIDNRRVIHGRTPFDDEHSGPGQRRLLLRTWIGASADWSAPGPSA